MLTIRLTRVGRKNDPAFRVIVIDSKRKVKAGNYLEMLGSYEPKMGKIELNAERIKHWLSMGAQTSDTVHNMLVSNKIIDAKKINVLPAFKAAPVAAATPEPSAPAEAPGTPAEVEPAPAEAPVEDTPAEATPETVNSDVVAQ